MIYDFQYYNPTKIYFGKKALDKLEKELGNYGDNILFMYGKNAIKSIGLYDEIMAILSHCGKNVVELSGINSNPRYSQVLEGARLVKENNVDLILAVGGGSVVDCAKAISVSAYANGDPWKRYWIDFEPVDNKIVPVGCVLTMAGTASEMEVRLSPMKMRCLRMDEYFRRKLILSSQFLILSTLILCLCTRW